MSSSSMNVRVLGAAATAASRGPSCRRASGASAAAPAPMSAVTTGFSITRVSRIIMRAMTLKIALFAVLLTGPALLAQNQTVRIHAATVLDGSGKTLKNATVVVQGSKITAIETGTA